MARSCVSVGSRRGHAIRSLAQGRAAMKDALGAVQSVLVLGGTSEIGVATARALVRGRARTVVLAARDPSACAAAADALRADGAERVETARFDATDFPSHATFIDEAFASVG